MTKVYLDNVNKFGVETFVLLDFSDDKYLLKESVLTREIKDHMKTGDYTFAILPDHPAYDNIKLKRSIVRIEDDNQIIFRGDVIKINTDKYGVKKVTCQNDLKWLVDVPDVFSKWQKSETTYDIGVDGGVVYLWFRDIPVPVTPGQPQQYHEYDGQRVYEHYERNSYISLKYIWSDYNFRVADVGKKYTVTIQNSSVKQYECELFQTQFTRANGPSVTVLYLGNLNMAPTPPGTDPVTMGLYDYDPGTEDLDGKKATDISTGAEAAEMDLTALDWCIVHYIDPRKPDKITGGSINYNGRNVTHIYTTQTPPLPPDEHSDRIAVACSTTSKTTVRSMVNSVFSEYAQTLTGYNACVEEPRRIYRGRIEIDGEIENSSVNTIYSNLSRWLDATGGYASIRYENNVAYIDLLADSGVKNDGFYVSLGDNVADYGKSADVLKLVTGIYPTGRWEPETDPESEEPQEEQIVTLKNATVNEREDFRFDAALGMVFHREAQLQYGVIVKAQEYDLSNIIESQWQQYLYDKACDDILTMLEAFTSFDVSAHDPRLLGKTGAAPVLGNYNPVDIPLWGDPTYMRLTKIITNHVKPSSDRLTFGDERAALSDYAAKGTKNE